LKKLFHATVEVTLNMVVLADTPEQARAWAEEHWHREVTDGCPDVNTYTPMEIRSEAEVPYGDWLEIPPYTVDDASSHETVGEMLRKGKPPAP
jgi:hypothetical protein